MLLDESLPRDLAPAVVGHDVTTVQRQGWAGLKNGDLLPLVPRLLEVLPAVRPGEVTHVAG